MVSRRRAAAFLGPLAAGICASLLVLTGPGDAAGLGLFDALLRLRPAGAFPREILLVEAESATAPGEWDGLGLAEGLAAMAELGAAYAVFPVPGSLGTAESRGAELAAAVDGEFAAIDANVAALFDAIRLGSVPPRDSPRYVAELLQTIEGSRTRLLEAASGEGSAERERLAGALRLLGRVYAAVDPLSDKEAGLRPGIEGLRGTGYAPLLLDADLSRRRLGLLSTGRATGFEHPAFAALLDRLGSPALARGRGLGWADEELVIKGASIVGGKKKDIGVPLSRGGLLIEWPRPLSGAPRRFPWSELGRAGLLEEELASALADLGEAGLLGARGRFLPSLREHAELLGEEALVRGEGLAAWREARERYFEEAGAFLAGPAEAELEAEIRERLLASASLEEAEELRFGFGLLEQKFSGARETRSELARLRARLEAEFAASFCVVAPARAAEGLGPTPHGQSASEGLATAAALGSILSERFLRELAPRLGAAAGALLALAVALASLGLGRRRAAAGGAVLALLASTLCAFAFIVTGVYLSPLGPALGSAAAALAALLLPRAGSAATARSRSEAGKPGA